MKKNYLRKLHFLTILFLMSFLGIQAQDNFALRLNTGGSETDYDGETFLADTYFDTGLTLNRPQTGLPEPYQTFRYSRSQQMAYDIPVPDGEYTVNLHFAELWLGATGGGLPGAGRRVFDVNIEGQLAEDDLDIFAEVGAEAMLVKTHTVTVTDGVLNIDFDSRDEVGGERHPVINAMEIIGGQTPQEIAIRNFEVWEAYISGDSGVVPGAFINDGDQIRNWENNYSFEGIGVEITSGVQSVLYEYTSPVGMGTEVHNTGNQGYISPVYFFHTEVGMYTITATPYSGVDQGGEAGTPATISFEVISSCDAVSFEVVNATTCNPNGGYAILRDEANNYEPWLDYNPQRIWEFDEELNAYVARNLSAGTYTIDYYNEYGCAPKTFTVGTDGCEEPRPFITTWKTDNPGISGGNQITISTDADQAYDYRVDWGDGTFSENVTGDITHTYETPGVYTVSINGDFPRIYFNDFFFNGDNDSQKILSIDQWGDIEWSDMQRAFQGCKNLDVAAMDVPNLSNVNKLSQMFDGCIELKGTTAFNDWDVSNIADAAWMFRNAANFNQDIGDWDVSNVGRTWGMFQNASSFNQDIGDWDVSEVGIMSNMFAGAASFDQDISGWNVSNVNNMGSLFQNASSFNQDIGDWNVSNVSEMNGMFFGAENFDQDIGNWDVTEVQYMDDMFHNATSFDQDLSGWDISGVTWNPNTPYRGMGGMFSNSGLSNENYDKTLIGWSQLPSLSTREITLDAPQNLYCDAEQARQHLIDTYGWTINDSGKDQECNTEPNDFALRINAGGAETDYNGKTYVADNYFDTGNTLDRPQTGLPEPYQTFRYGPSQQMAYGIPVPDGEYTVNLHFAELWFGATGGGLPGAGRRVFDVNIEGQLAEDDLDIFAEVGAEAMLVKTHTVTVTDGVLNIDFDSRDEVGGERHPVINAIEILGEGSEPEFRPFITTWKTDAFWGTSPDDQIVIPTHPEETYNYTVDWGDGTTSENVTGDIAHTYATPGTYTVSISGGFPRIYFNDNDVLDRSGSDARKLTSVEQWGDIEWSSMQNAFLGCAGMDVVAMDVPDLSEVESLESMFEGCLALLGNDTFNSWDVSKVTDMSSMFSGIDHGNWYDRSSFDQDISDWDVSNVTNMNRMFLLCRFNQDISDWDVSKVTDMGSMFFHSAFNMDIGDWEVGSVTNMKSMFIGEVFDQDIGNWDVSNVTDMSFMFSGGYIPNGDDPSEFENPFNQDISGWDVSNVIDMSGMFGGTNAFDQDIGGWDVSNVTNMYGIFSQAEAFNQDLGDWDVSSVEPGEYSWSSSGMKNMFTNSALSNTNYDNTLIGWSQLPILKTGVQLDAPQNQYCEAEEARQHIINTYGWIINDAGEAVDCNEARPFVTTWKTDNPGTSGNNQITIPTFPGETYDYTVNWGDGNTSENVTSDITHTYATPGTYTVSISGDFPRIYFRNSGDRQKILAITQWGDVQWSSMEESFSGCDNLDVVASDVPILSSVESLKFMFNRCSSLVGTNKFDDWDVSNVTDMSSMFSFATNFNKALGNWDVSNVAIMNSMFAGTSFNQDIGDWDVSNVENMGVMFYSATSFNQDIGGWDVSEVRNMDRMFHNASAFNQDISAWDVSNVDSMWNMFVDAFSQSNENYDKMLIGWSQLPSLQNSVEFDAPNNQYCAAEQARQQIIDTYGWLLIDGGKAENCGEGPNDFALRINAGGSETEFNGEAFIADTYFDTGLTLDRPQTGLSEPHKTFRYSPSQVMGYAIPVPNGEYTVGLHFAELWFGATGGGLPGTGRRVFDVSMEGQLVEDNLDIFAEVGAETMLIRGHVVTVTDGILNIDFDSRDIVGGERHPVINAIEIIGVGNQGGSGKLALGKNQDNNDMVLYPNQVSDFANVGFERPTEVRQVYVFDIGGRLVNSYSPEEIRNGDVYTIDVTQYQQGAYIVKMIDGKGENFEKQMMVKRQ